MKEKAMRRLIVFITLILVIVFAAEIGYRLWVIRGAMNNKDLQMFTLYTDTFLYSSVDKAKGYQGPINEIKATIPLFKTSRDVLAWQFEGPESKLIHAFSYHLNNAGMISTKDYYPERDDDRLRIVTIGCEQTGSSTSPVSWPDYLEDLLNQAPSAASRRVAVYNLGAPDAGFRHFAELSRLAGEKLKPDIVIVNIVEHDYQRIAKGERTIFYHGKPMRNWQAVKYQMGAGEESTAYIIGVSSKSNITSLKDPEVTCGRPFALYVSKKLGENPDKVKALQKKVLDDFIGGAVWSRRNSLLLDRIMGKPFDPIAFRSFDPIEQAIPTEEEQIADARKHLLSILSDHKKVIFIHNVNIAEIQEKKEWKLSRELIRREPSLKYVDMKDYLPPLTNIDEVKTWYQYPFMSEKWSQKGHKMYAEAVAKVLRERQ
jgi:hypothetical protein